MEEILQELIKTTLEKGPQNKQFYSNLSITKPIHDQVEIQVNLCDAVTFLKSKLTPNKGFQSKLYTSRNCAIECVHVNSSLSIPENTVEILTSVLALDLLFNDSDKEQFIAPRFQEIICNFSQEVRDSLHDLIVPTFGLSTFNLFKQFQESSSVSFSPSPVPNHQIQHLYRDDFDSGNDSPISMFSSASNPPDSLNTANILNDFPDDINTSMLTLHVLLHQGIIQSKPVESVLRWVISNVFTFENENFNEEATSSSEDAEKHVEVTFPAFINRQGNSDPIGVANLLSLMYLLDISHEVFLNAAEKFLVMTLKHTITAVNPKESTKTTNSLLETISASSIPVNSLGNTHAKISSDGNGQKPANNESYCRNEDEALTQQHQQSSSFVLQHHSPDSLLYFLSRALAISPTLNNSHSENCTRRPYISQMKSLLLDLLDARLGTTVNTCDLAMRILAGVYLGVVMVSTNNTANLNSCSSNTIITNSRHHQREMLQVQQNERYCSLASLPCNAAKISRINNILQKEFELLVSLQNDADGSWQADSIVQVGFCENTTSNSANSLDDVTNCKYGIESQSSENEVLTMGYLGGKELATLFAVKAISVYLSRKKETFDCEEEENWGESERHKSSDADVEIHQLY